ncbi:MAG: repair protein RecN [Chloroflexota bacterium]|jgi:DNA repair protein RecN (Recombination protein N)|nr:repair protein RecN [Chloroflexota bacterium]
MSLLELAVTDLALIERARVGLRPGFTVITGETGAGKSLLIDALTLVLGGRADAGLVRTGAESARVEALFERDPEPMICVRELAATGRTIARIDDETVTVSRLAATVSSLVEIHGQHDQQRLLDAATQRELLDSFGGHGALREAVRTAVQALRENEAGIRELELDPGELARRLELAEHAAAEIEAAAPVPNEVEALRARLASAANAERLARLSSQLHERLAGEGGGARDQLGLAAHDAAELSRLDGRLADIEARLLGLEAEVEDVALDLRRRSAESESDAGDRERLEERLGLLYGLLRKYGESEEAVLEHGERSRAEADRLRGLDSERARRTAAAERLDREARDAAAALTDARLAAAARLGREVTAALRELGFPDGAFQVQVVPASLDITGADAVAFVLAPNPGEAARPLARIASGGELSRVALAIKSVLAEADATPTLVFDEVDAGIGGRSADPVGARLWRLARSHQVLCVTHLAQIAAHADAHLHIEKRVRDDGRTVTEVHELATPEERIAELAAMLGGATGDQAVLDAARGLLGRAASARTVAR